MNILINEQGNQYGEWYVDSFAYSKNGDAYWNVTCSCGKKSTVRGNKLRGSYSKSCKSCSINNGKFKKGERPSIKTEFKKGDRVSIKTEFKKGQVPWSKGIPCSDETKIKISSTLRNISVENWDGFSASERQRDMNTLEYTNFRQQVFERDDFTCHRCGKQGVYLNAHHLLSYTYFPQYRYEPWNGVTLCKECHYWTHSNKNTNKVYVMGVK